MKRMMMVLVLAGVLVLAAVGPATAHKLSLSDAALEGRSQLSEYADNQCNDDGVCDLATYPKMTRYDCSRSSRHIVRCTGEYELLDFDSDYSFTDESCTASIKAKYASHRSYTPRIRVYNVSCY